MRVWIGALVLGAAIAAGASAQDDPAPWAGCPALANVDVPALRALEAEWPLPEMFDDAIGLTPGPVEALAAPVRIRVWLPAHPLGGVERRVTAWRMESGAWFIARRDINAYAPPPHPPVPEDERFPLRAGRMDATDSAWLDAALADPCLAHEVDRMRHTIPLIGGAGRWICPADSTALYGEITQPGRPVRRVAMGCNNQLHTPQILMRVLGAGIAE